MLFIKKKINSLFFFFVLVHKDLGHLGFGNSQTNKKILILDFARNIISGIITIRYIPMKHPGIIIEEKKVSSKNI
jgi:hypothetical protein